MNGIPSIMERLRREAQAQRQEAHAQMEAQLTQLHREFQEQARQLARQEALRGQQEVLLLRRQQESQTALECRQLLLSARQDCVDEAFSTAEKQLHSLPRAQRIRLLARLAAAPGCGGVLILSPEDRSLGEAVVEQARRLCPDVRFTLSAQTRPLGGGLLLQSGRVTYDGSFATRLQLLREELATRVAAILSEETEADPHV